MVIFTEITENKCVRGYPVLLR